MIFLCRVAVIAMVAMAPIGVAFAQQPGARPAAPAGQPPAAQAPAAPIPPASNFAPTHLALARDVALASGITRSLDLVAPQFFDRLRQQALSRPELTKDLGEVFNALQPEMELQKQNMVNTMARIFASRMTEAELKDVAGFFNSPSGRKYVETQPQVLDDLVKEMETWSQELAEYVMVRVRAEMVKRGHKM